jgi:LacI family repressor for deo operon, udp, cdd, tsx, nupC, and nupG
MACGRASLALGQQAYQDLERVCNRFHLLRRAIAFPLDATCAALQAGPMPDGPRLRTRLPAARLKMEDIAALAGVSAATVSRALSGSAAVTDQTRRRVEDAAASAGYVVNRVARGLRTQRSHQLLVILPTIANSFFADVVLGMEDAAQEAGYSLLVGSTEGSSAREEALARQLLTGTVDGLLVLTGRRAEAWSSLPEASQRVVAISEGIPRAGIPLVTVNNRAAAQDAVQLLLSQGHKRIGFISGPADNILTAQRRRGYLAALAGARIPACPELMVAGPYSFAAGALGFQTLRALRLPPTAIFCCNDDLAIGVMRAARLDGLRVPEDISVIGFDDIAVAEVVDPPLTTIRQPRRDMGRHAVRVLLQALDGSAPARRHVLPYRLIMRNSTAAVGPD